MDREGSAEGVESQSLRSTGLVLQGRTSRAHRDSEGTIGISSLSPSTMGVRPSTSAKR